MNFPVASVAASPIAVPISIPILGGNPDLAASAYSWPDPQLVHNDRNPEPVARNAKHFTAFAMRHADGQNVKRSVIVLVGAGVFLPAKTAMAQPLRELERHVDGEAQWRL